MTVLTRTGGGSAAASSTPSGPAGGDLAGTYPDPTLAAGTVLFDAYALLQDQKAANTAGGTATSGSFQDRDLNTEVYDSAGMVTLSTPSFTLQGGRTYLIKASAPAFTASGHKAKIRNQTAGSDVAFGTSEKVDAAHGDPVTSRSFVKAVVSPGSDTAYRIQHRVEVTQATNGFGRPNNFGVIEVYTEVEIYRFAA